MADRIPAIGPERGPWIAELDLAADRLRGDLRSPLDLAAVCSGARVRVEFRSPILGSRLEGSYSRQAKGPVITLYRPRLRAELTTRERMTLSHEVGHWVLEGLAGQASAHQDPQVEALCDHFAARLLISEQDLHPVNEAARADPVTLLDTLPTLGDQCGTSLLVAAGRVLRALGGGRAVVTQRQGRPARVDLPRLPEADPFDALGELRRTGQERWHVRRSDGELVMARRLRSELHPALFLALPAWPS